jgi:rhomboid family GlyGly-CTERM serine protease
MNGKTGGCQQEAARREASPSLLLALTALGVYFTPAIADALQFERTAIAAGQFWRLATCHLTHWSADHLFWDVLMFAALGMICEQMSRVHTRRCLIAAAAVIPLAVWLTLPNIAMYRGLSGIDSALFGLLVGLIFKDRSHSRATVLIVLMLAVTFGAKICYETLAGATLFVESGGVFTPVPLAHLVGGVVGVASAMDVPWLLFWRPTEQRGIQTG